MYTTPSDAREGAKIRELVDKPDEQSAVMGTVFGIKLAGFVLGAVALLIYAFALSGHSVAEKWLFVAAAAAILLGSVTNVLSNWFRARVEARYASIANIATSVSGAGLKIALVMTGARVVAVGFAQAASAALGVVVITFTCATVEHRCGLGGSNAIARGAC